MITITIEQDITIKLVLSSFFNYSLGIGWNGGRISNKALSFAHRPTTNRRNVSVTVTHLQLMTTNWDVKGVTVQCVLVQFLSLYSMKRFQSFERFASSGRYVSPSCLVCLTIFVLSMFVHVFPCLPHAPFYFTPSRTLQGYSPLQSRVSIALN